MKKQRDYRNILFVHISNPKILHTQNPNGFTYSRVLIASFITRATVISSNVHRIVACFKQRVRLLLSELYNLILFRIAQLRISVYTIARELYALYSQNLGSARLIQNLTLNSCITIVVCFHRLDDGHHRCAKTSENSLSIPAYRDVPSLPNKDSFIRSDEHWKRARGLTWNQHRSVYWLRTIAIKFFPR